MKKLALKIIILGISIVILSSCQLKRNNTNDLAVEIKDETILNRDQLETVINALKNKTIQPMISLISERKTTTVFNSKLGGTPYLPLGFDYPYNESALSNKQPLKLLAQINFAELPRIQDFPSEGILQFYIAYEESDNTMGLNFDNLSEQTSFRVVYHEKVIKDADQLQNPPKIDTLEDYYFPFTGEFLLTGLVENSFITPTDYRFNDLFIQNLNDVTGIKIKKAWDLPKENYSKIYEELSSVGHRIGGYPFFTQEDPRSNEPNYDVLLLQIDSQFDNNYEIIWGDLGVANFFISLEDLKNRDFSNVIYTWDCY